MNCFGVLFLHSVKRMTDKRGFWTPLTQRSVVLTQQDEYDSHSRLPCSCCPWSSDWAPSQEHECHRTERITSWPTAAEALLTLETSAHLVCEFGAKVGGRTHEPVCESVEPDINLTSHSVNIFLLWAPPRPRRSPKPVSTSHVSCCVQIWFHWQRESPPNMTDFLRRDPWIISWGICECVKKSSYVEESDKNNSWILFSDSTPSLTQKQGQGWKHLKPNLSETWTFEHL